MTTSYCPDDHIRHFMLESIAAALITQAWEPRPHSVLDFGSRWFGDGDGGWATLMRGVLKDVIGREFVDHHLAVYPELDIQHLAIGDNQFDILVADQVLEHVPRPWLAAPEIHRVLKPGGIAVVCTPFLYPIHGSPDDYWRLTPSAYKVLFPEGQWETLVLDFWGNAARVGFEYTQKGAFPEGRPDTSVAQAMGEPFYVAGNDGRCPLQIWWVGKKR